MKATFEAPSGEDAVVVDLLGLNKGVAWVNGNNLGRYWPSYTAAEMAGCHRCDYRGAFQAEGDGTRCLTGCGEPSQRYYHVPRSFLAAGEPNTLLLFEEAGGDPRRRPPHRGARRRVHLRRGRGRRHAVVRRRPRRVERRRGQLRRGARAVRRLRGRVRVQGGVRGVHGGVRREGVVHGGDHRRVRRRRVPVRRAHRPGHLLIVYGVAMSLIN